MRVESPMLDEFLNKQVRVTFLDNSTRTGIFEKSKNYPGCYAVGILNFSKECVKHIETINVKGRKTL